MFRGLLSRLSATKDRIGEMEDKSEEIIHILNVNKTKRWEI